MSSRNPPLFTIIIQKTIHFQKTIQITTHCYSALIGMSTKMQNKKSNMFLALLRLFYAEVESRTQGPRPRPRPRTQKKSEAKAKAKDSLSEDRHSRGQGQECSRPRPRTKDTKRKCSQKKKKKKKVFTKIFQAISTKKRFPKNFSSAPQNFNIPINRAVLEPRTGQFSRT